MTVYTPPSAASLEEIPEVCRFSSMFAPLVDVMTAPATTTDPIQQLFARRRLRCTRQRRALYEALSATRAHPTADQLYQKVAGTEQDISLATVYNTLEAFCRAGLAQKLLGRGGSTRYDATTHNHLHLRDAESDTVSDVPDNLGERFLQNIPQHILAELEVELGFKISQLQIELVGQFAVVDKTSTPGAETPHRAVPDTL